jgi:DNA-binding beta-propeller fold protein YncE
MPRTRKTTVALVAAAALIIPAGAAEASDPLVTGLISPLGLAVYQGDFYVANAFAGFVNVNGEFPPIASAAGLIAGVDVSEDGTVAYTATEDQENLQTFLYLADNSDPLAALGAYERNQNPDKGNEYGLLDASPSCQKKLADKIGTDAIPYSGRLDSNPYAVASDGADGWYVADAAANAILHVSEGGAIETVAVLPPVEQVLTKTMRKVWRVPRIDGQPNPERVKLPQCAVGQTYYGEPVPTDVEVGTDGMLYVSLLPGFPEVGGNVVKVDPETGNLVGSPLASGLAGAVDVAVSPDGAVYVAELFGDAVSKWVGGSMVESAFVLMPGAVEVEGDRVFATAGVFADSGSVVEITFSP